MERRSSLRVACGIEVVVRLKDSELRAELMNISQRGLFLRPNLQSPRAALLLTSAWGRDDLVSFQILLRGRRQRVTALGKIAWKSDLGVGIDFQVLSGELAQYIERLAAPGADVRAILAEIAEPPSIEAR